MTTPHISRKVTIIGAGLAGSFLAVCLGRQGFDVTVCERRSDLRREIGGSGGPSMNLGLSRRGLEALTEIGLIDTVLPQTIQMHGRMIHNLDGTRSFQAYGQAKSEGIYAVKRKDLNIALINKAETLPNVRFLFEQRCVQLDKTTATVELRDEQTGQQQTLTADFIVGADGVFSIVRQQMQRGERANFQQEFLEWGWKELTIPPTPEGTFYFEREMFHLWPRGDYMIFAHPNHDGSFCCSCVLPFEGPYSLNGLKEPAEVDAFFKRLFPDIVPLVPTLAQNFLRSPTVPLISIRTSQWHYRDRVVLIGDACHAVYPFYAQGMNSAFEDCLVLASCLQEHGPDLEQAFAAYQSLRKRNTDTLANISRENFVELRDTIRSPLLHLRRQIDSVLGRIFPQRWMPLHALITNTTIPYADAVERIRQQDQWLRWGGLGSAVLTLLLSAQAARHTRHQPKAGAQIKRVDS